MRPADFLPMLNYVKNGRVTNILPIKEDTQLSIYTSSSITFDGKIVVALLVSTILPKIATYSLYLQITIGNSLLNMSLLKTL